MPQLAAYPAFAPAAWYVVAWSDEVSPGHMLPRTALGQALVVMRTGAGRVAVLRDRCAHRHAPLSCGRVESDGIRCLYHGLKFGADGSCIDIPGQSDIPRRFKVDSFPSVEQDRLIWAWFGDSEKAATTPVPRLPLHVDPQWRLLTGRTHVRADFRLLVDNAMDLTHLAWCHMSTFGAAGASTVKPSLTPHEHGLRYVYHYRNSTLPDFHRRVTQWEGTVDRVQAVDWEAPCTFRLSVQFTPDDPEDLRRGRSSPMHAGSSHLFTPETDHTTHYFWGAPLHTDFASDENLAAWAKIVSHGFEAEDKPMIEAQQANITRHPPGRMNATQYDEAVYYARRMLDRLRSTDPGSVDERH